MEILQSYFSLLETRRRRTTKKRPTQLCTTQLYKNIQTSKFHADYFITSFCIISSLRSHLATIASVEFSWFETKTYPITTHIDASHCETFRSSTNIRTLPTRLGGENPRQNENIALEPRFGKGKLPVVLKHSHSHSHPHQLERERPRACWCDITLTPLRFSFMFIAVGRCMCVCVWVVESRSLMKNFQFQNGDRRVFATFVFGSSGNVSNATLRGRVTSVTDCT